jgi:hypothetical protein
MAWTTSPANDTDFNAYAFIKQFYYALQERHAAINNNFYWPKTSAAWTAGTITSQSVTVMEDDTRGDDDWIKTSGACTGPRWTSWDCEPAPYQSADYSVVLNCDSRDESKIVVVPITSNDETTLTHADITDWITAGYISSTSYFVGKKYAIVNRNIALWWHMRLPTLPNDYEHWRGTTTAETTTTATDSDPTTKWTVNQFAGKDLLVYGTDGKLKRKSIISNTDDTLTFASNAVTVTGTYIIVDSGGKGFPNKQGGLPCLAYGGYTENYATVKPADDMLDVGAVSYSPLPRATKVWDEGTLDTECEPVTHNAYDIDLWTATDAECENSDYCYTPKFFATVRGLQVAVETMAQSFCKPIDWSSKKEIHSFTIAELFHYINVNAFSTTATASTVGDTTSATFAFSVPYSGVEMYYDIQADGVRITQGQGSTSGSLTVEVSADYAGQSLTLLGTWGWTRVYPREFRHAYPRTAFIPDFQTVELEGVVVYDPAEVYDYCCDLVEDPPPACCKDCFGVGEYIRREKSTTYKELDGYQRVIDGSTSFVTNELARYVGDNWGDVGVNPDFEVGTTDPTPGYWRNLSYQKMAKEQNDLKLEAMRGSATSGGTWFIRDTDKDWLGYPFGNGVNRTETGTTTGGSSTTLVDSVITDDENERHCFWKSERNVWGKFTLEVDIDLDEYGQPITVKVPISSSNEATGTITFPSYCGLTVASGKTYRIKEPKHKLNIWEGRTIEITKTDGTKLTATITGNDGDTLFFAPLAEAVQAGWTYAIIEMSVGGVYKWNGSAWVEASGSDPRGQPFHRSVFENLPTKAVRYGKACQGDYVTTKLMEELYLAINALIHVKYEIPWTSREDPETEELNTWQPIQQLYDIGCVSIGGDGTDEDWYGYGEPPTGGLLDCYANVEESESDGAAPYWFCSGTLFPTNSSIYGGACYAYGLAEGIPNKMSRGFDFYAVGWINASNPDPLNETMQGCYVRNEPWNGIYHTGENNANTIRLFDNTSTGLSFRTFTKYSSVGANTDTRVVSDRLGSNSPVPPVDKPMAFFNELRDADECGDCCDGATPPPCTGGPDLDCGHEYNEWDYKSFGSYAASNTVVVKWNVSGGFVYC